MITKKTFDFLERLEKNNNREWFEEHRDLYEQSYGEMQELAMEVNRLMASHDHIVELSPKRSIFRIYRDVRFSKDKTPYKVYWGGKVKRDTPLLRGGYYYHVEPGGSFVAAGFWGPDSKDLKLIRNHIAQDHSVLERINRSADFRSEFPRGIQGDKLVRSPQGYDMDHPAIEWLQNKQFIVQKYFPDEEVVHPDFAEKINHAFKTVRPFLNYMSEILTTNLNGEPLYE
ncbi:DUF2461 domain-containing protein [Portibacter marinus]|uniref:DUF2461 domain-containing protein n=1 Tax=Portibacter marinus TaxID=2898660 RepID=UPI001F187EB3|nr:DUF2461 domain-containing protein [Portibacter marinus]